MSSERTRQPKSLGLATPEKQRHTGGSSSRPYLSEASPLVRRFGTKLAAIASTRPILDVACGSGRNAIVMAQLGCAVTCVDKDLTGLEVALWRLHQTSFADAAKRIAALNVDLVKDAWPFGPRTVSGIINVHFFLPELFRYFESSLYPGGFLLFETVPGCGGNYLELPKSGQIRCALEQSFDFEFYNERRVGPSTHGSVTVQTVARKKMPE
jgi:SAM-dependent methyltransferase